MPTISDLRKEMNLNLKPEFFGRR